MERNTIIQWLSFRLHKDLDGYIFYAWLFGSITSNETTANDCDLLLVYEEEAIKRVVSISQDLRKDFIATFHIPLHLTRITPEEVKDGTELIIRVFSKKHIVIP